MLMYTNIYKNNSQNRISFVCLFRRFCEISRIVLNKWYCSTINCDNWESVSVFVGFAQDAVLSASFHQIDGVRNLVHYHSKTIVEETIPNKTLEWKIRLNVQFDKTLAILMELIIILRFHYSISKNWRSMAGIYEFLNSLSDWMSLYK